VEGKRLAVGVVGQMVPVRDNDLWQRMDRALQFHQVYCGRRRLDPPHGRLEGPHWNLPHDGGRRGLMASRGKVGKISHSGPGRLGRACRIVDVPSPLRHPGSGTESEVSKEVPRAYDRVVGYDQPVD